MELIKIKSEKKFTDKKSGKERNIWYFAIRHDNGKITPIKPIYKDGYSALNFDAKVEK